MKNIMEKLNDNEEGEELKDILSENDSDEDKNIDNTNDKQMQKLEIKKESFSKYNKYIAEKRNSKSTLKKFLFVIISIIVIAAIAILVIYLKHISKKPPPKVEKYNECQWFIDGKSYFEDLFHKLMHANNTIFISDWWLSPEVFLRRPVNVTPYLDMIQKKYNN